MKIIKHGILFAFIIGIALSILLPAHASNLISQQQQELKSVSPAWTEQHIPAGMPKAISLGDARTSTTQGVALFAKNVDFIFTDGIGFHIEELSASFEPLNPNEPVNMDDPRQFIIHVHSGSVVVSPEGLTNLFNHHILDYWPRPLNAMTVCTEPQVLVAKGGLRLWNWLPPIGWLPASLKGGIVVSQNKMVYTPYDVRALGIPLSGLFNALGIKLSMLLTLNRQGAQLVGNSLILDHTKVFPPPELQGCITDLHLDCAGLHLKFDDHSNSLFSPPSTAPNSFIWIQSGDIKLYNTVVTNANILIKNHDEKRDLYFDLYNYRDQIGDKNVVKMAADGSIEMTLYREAVHP